MWRVDSLEKTLMLGGIGGPQATFPQIGSEKKQMVGGEFFFLTLGSEQEEKVLFD